MNCESSDIVVNFEFVGAWYCFPEENKCILMIFVDGLVFASTSTTKEISGVTLL